MGLRLNKDTLPGRNEPCPCRSGLKYKHCHGDLIKQKECSRVANVKMVELIQAEVNRKEELNGTDN